MVATVPLCFSTLIRGQAKYLSQYFQVKLVTSLSEENKNIAKYEGLDICSIDMTRRITPFKDFVALWKLIGFFRKEKPDLVYTFTPKAGLLGMLAAFILRVPRRVHNVVGMPLMEAVGYRALLLKYSEKLTYGLATHLFCNSFGLKKFISANLTKHDIQVVANGSINGVDTGYFQDDYSDAKKSAIRQKYSISSDEFVFSYIGRLVKDKGINELILAFNNLLSTYHNVKLLLVGDAKLEHDLLSQQTLNTIATNPNIISVGFQSNIKDFLSISDSVVLPSYREGLPNALIEAGSFGLLLIATNIEGCNEIIQHNHTGLLIKAKDVEDLQSAMEIYINNRVLRDKVQSNIRQYIVNTYDQTMFWRSLKEVFEKLLD